MVNTIYLFRFVVQTHLVPIYYLIHIPEIAKEFIATFNAQYVLAYGVEFTKMKMKQVDKEAYGEPETDKELMYREVISSMS